MPRLQLVSPAPLTDVLELAPPRRPWRGAMILQARRSQTVSLRIDGLTVALVMFYPENPARVEFCLHVRPEAARHMLRLTRAMQLIGPPIADTGVEIVARTWPGNVRSRRLARLAGFRPVDDGETFWRWGSDGRDSEGPFRGRRCQKGG